jgi:hypothetical protein
VRPNGGHPTETDQRCCVISLVTTLTGNPAENIHRKTACILRLYCLFCNSMEYSALCDVLIDQVTFNHVTWFIVTVRMLAAGHSHKLCYNYGVRFWTVFLSFKQWHVIFVDKTLWYLNIRTGFNIIFPSDSSSKNFNKCNIISLIPVPTLSLPSNPPFPLISSHPNTICCQHTILVTSRNVLHLSILFQIFFSAHISIRQ